MMFVLQFVIDADTACANICTHCQSPLSVFFRRASTKLPLNARLSCAHVKK